LNATFLDLELSLTKLNSRGNLKKDQIITAFRANLLKNSSQLALIITLANRLLVQWATLEATSGLRTYLL
jgi:hypothetical protein